MLWHRLQCVWRLRATWTQDWFLSIKKVGIHIQNPSHLSIRNTKEYIILQLCVSVGVSAYSLCSDMNLISVDSRDKISCHEGANTNHNMFYQYNVTVASPTGLFTFFFFYFLSYAPFSITILYFGNWNDNKRQIKVQQNTGEIRYHVIKTEIDSLPRKSNICCEAWLSLISLGV